MHLKTVVRFLDETLKVADFSGDSSLNGLQVEGTKSVNKICLAVDACEKSISGAARCGADLLIVHHGLLWNEVKPVTGPTARRLGLLLERGISLYAAHLPLDCHPDIGNNARLAGLLDIKECVRFGRYHGFMIGLCGYPTRPITPHGLARKVKILLEGPVKIFPFGPPRIKRLGIVSGGGASLVQEAAEAGCDAFLTGEPAHSAYHKAREAGINLICAGHYATETLGVRALGGLLNRELGLPVKFLDIPTGL